MILFTQSYKSSLTSPPDYTLPCFFPFSQVVLFTQQLILFAPQAVQAARAVPLLQATLLSRQPALRNAAAATLRHLAEGDPAAVRPQHIEPALFAAIDSESNTAIIRA